MTRGIVGYGAYVPFHRLKRSAISAALGSGGGKGTRAVASYDEDSTSMAVEAARNLLRSSEAPIPAALHNYVPQNGQINFTNSVRSLSLADVDQ